MFVKGFLEDLIHFLHSVTEHLSITLLAGGHDQNSFLASAEFIPATKISNSLPSLPKSILGSHSMFLHNETIMICGGQNNLKTCLKLQEGSWTEYNSLKEGRSHGALVSTTTATFIFGGYYSEDTYEYLEKNAASEWKLGETKIPGGFHQGCSVAISQDEIWLLGGYDNEQRVLSFNVNNQKFTVLPTELKQGRYEHRCAFIPGTRNIIVTGGFIFEPTVSTEIIDVETRNVTEGPSMNSKRANHGIGVLDIERQERLVVFGGQASAQASDTSYHKSVEFYNAQMQKWQLTNIELSVAKYNFGFMTIKSQP